MRPACILSCFLLLVLPGLLLPVQGQSATAKTSAIELKKETRLLLQAVVRLVVPRDFEYFHLVDSSFVLGKEFPTYSTPDLDAFFHKNPGFHMQEFIAASGRARKIAWADDAYDIRRARIGPLKNIPPFESQAYITTVLPFNTPDSTLDRMRKERKRLGTIVRKEKGWGDAEIREASRKEWERYSNSLNPEDKKFYVFSTPLFSGDHQYAVIRVDNATQGKCYVFKKTGEKWEYRYTLWGWVA